MSAEDDDDVPYKRKRKPEPDSEIDITPMIDVTFQLLIFFMVTSTMQGNPPAEVPKSSSGGMIEVAKVILVVIKAPVGTADPVIEIDDVPVTLEELRVKFSDAAEASSNGIDVMLMVDRTVPNRFTGEIESLIGEISGVTYHFAVEDRRD